MVMTDNNTYATTALITYVDRYGTEGLDWAPETIALQIAEDFGAPPTKAVFDRLMAAITLLKTNYFYVSLPKFIDLCNIISGMDFMPGVFNPADSGEMAWAITEAAIIYPEQTEFVDDIKHYMAATLKEEGFITLPSVYKPLINDIFPQYVSFNFTDDPEMFSGVYKIQQDKVLAIDGVVRENMLDLVGQLRRLPLQNGSGVDIVKALTKELQGAD